MCVFFTAALNTAICLTACRYFIRLRVETIITCAFYKYEVGELEH